MEEYYQKKYKKYKIKYLEKKIINKELIGGNYDNIVIFFINNINDNIDNNEVNTIIIKELEIEIKLHYIVINIIKFLLCVTCHLITLNTSIIDVTSQLLLLLSDFFSNKINIKDFINKLDKIIPCSDQLNDIFTQLFTELKNYIESNISISKTNIIFLNNFKNELIKHNILLNFFTNSLTNKTCFTTITKTEIMDQINKYNITTFFSGGNYKNILNIKLNFKDNCSNFTTLDVFNMYNTIKNFTAEQLNDVIIGDIKNNIIKILYICKYLINFIFKLIFKNIKDYTIFNILDFIDTLLSLTIVISILSLDNMKEYFIIFITKIMPKNELSNQIINLLNIMFITQTCNK